MKKIKFKNVGVDLRGEQNGMAFSILLDHERATTGEPTYYVGVYSDAGDLPWFSTWGHRYFDVDAAKEFCRQITAGEIDVETLRAEFAAEDTSAVSASKGDAVPYEFYIDGEPAAISRPAPEVTELELAIAVRCARAFRPDLARSYIHTKKKRIRKKYAKRILIWYWGVICRCSD